MMKCVLIIEDSKTSAFLIQTIFQRRGSKVLIAETGEKGIKLCRKHKPDIIILDYLLPDTTGNIICRQLKADPQTAHIPILIVTAHGNEKIIHACLKAGADDILLKPYRNEELNRKVAQLLRVPIRKSMRILVRFEVVGSDKFSVYFGTSENISVTGMFMVTQHTIEPGSHISLDFFLPGDTVKIHLDAEVVRREYLKDQECFGYGLHFLNVPPEIRARIQKFIEGNLRRTGQSFSHLPDQPEMPHS